MHGNFRPHLRAILVAKGREGVVPAINLPGRSICLGRARRFGLNKTILGERKDHSGKGAREWSERLPRGSLDESVDG